MGAALYRNSPFRPLRGRVFRTMWLATLVSNIGGWAGGIATVWLMTTLTNSAVMVALVQALSTLPIFLFGLPSGALADIVDRRRIILATLVFAFVTAIALTAMYALSLVTPTFILIVSFLFGTGAAIAAPAFQAIVPDLVEKEDLKAAVSLNSVGINIARAIGPAIGGALITAFGVTVAFMLNAVTYVGPILAFLRWRAPVRETQLPAERFISAIKAGMRYTRESPGIQAVIWRACYFYIPAACYWALLPLMAKTQLRGTATTYGVLLTSIGSGAIGAAFLLPYIRQKVGQHTLLAASCFMTAALMAALSLSTSLTGAVPLLVIAGATWITCLSTFNVSALAALPDWVKSRGLAVYIVAFNGALTLGSVGWGRVADSVGIPATLQIAAALLFLTTVLGLSKKLPDADVMDLSPSLLWPSPVTSQVEGEGHNATVLVTVEYFVRTEDVNSFNHALSELGRTRRRDGAIYWQHFRHTEDATRHMEVFLLDSWEEHLRQHERFPVQDRPIQEAVTRFHCGSSVPRVDHYWARPDG